MFKLFKKELNPIVTQEKEESKLPELKKKIKTKIKYRVEMNNGQFYYFLFQDSVNKNNVGTMFLNTAEGKAYCVLFRTDKWWNGSGHMPDPYQIIWTDDGVGLLKKNIATFRREMIECQEEIEFHEYT